MVAAWPEFVARKGNSGTEGPGPPSPTGAGPVAWLELPRASVPSLGQPSGQGGCAMQSLLPGAERGPGLEGEPGFPGPPHVPFPPLVLRSLPRQQGPLLLVLVLPSQSFTFPIWEVGMMNAISICLNSSCLCNENGLENIFMAWPLILLLLPKSIPCPALLRVMGARPLQATYPRPSVSQLPAGLSQWEALAGGGRPEVGRSWGICPSPLRVCLCLLLAPAHAGQATLTVAPSGVGRGTAPELQGLHSLPSSSALDVAVHPAVQGSILPQCLWGTPCPHPSPCN